MACPYFMPTNKLEGGWIHPSRLPLGAGWAGQCSAPGYEGIEPASDELRECNLGYASSCTRLPAQRSCDAVRFAIARDRGTQLLFTFVCESAHLPSSHGLLEYDLSLDRWTSTHPDARIQKMADCYRQAYVLRRPQPTPTPSLRSAKS